MLILGLTFSGNSHRAEAAQTPANKGVVAIAFISSFANSTNAASFQRIMLNVVSVRLNPSTDPNVSDFAGNWVTIGVPAGVGKSFGVGEVSTGSNFGGNFSSSNNNVSIGEGRSEIQIDLRAIQNIAQIFNAQAITAKTFHVFELVLDTATPGNVVPMCPGGSPAGEGCINYKAQFPQITPTPPVPLSIRTFSASGLDLSNSQHVVTPLVIQVDPGLGAPPTASSDNVQINPSITLVTNTPGTVPPAPFINQDLGSIQGTITTNVTGGFVAARPQSITARVAGTNNIIETLTLPNSCNGKKTCEFILYLPAAAAIPSGPGAPGGTNYDLVASAKGVSYAVRSNVNVIAGQDTDLRATPFAVVSKGTVNFTGKVFDLCTSLGVQAATLNLLVPDPLVTTSCALVAAKPFPPAGCVVAASAATDEVGNFPLPGNGNVPAAFSVVPLPATGKSYTLSITAAGFDRTPVAVTANGSVLKCNPTKKTGACNINLSHGLMTGNVSLGSGTGPLNVLIAAEDAGTNNVENLTLVNLPGSVSSVPFTMNVPDNLNPDADGNPVTKLDLFASTQDLFNGSPQQATGHSFAVTADVTAPDPPSGSPLACAAPVVAPDLSGMTCVGHGSVGGNVDNPVSTDTVVLSKDGVQIQSVPVVPPGASGAGAYAICAPADSYTLTHYAQAMPFPTAYGTPVPVTLSAAAMVPTPAPSPGVTPTPCPGICEISPPNANTGCLTCTATSPVNGF
jgi:hypothetical protein